MFLGFPKEDMHRQAFCVAMEQAARALPIEIPCRRIARTSYGLVVLSVGLGSPLAVAPSLPERASFDDALVFPRGCLIAERKLAALVPIESCVACFQCNAKG